MARRYFSQSLIDFLSGQKNGFFLISFSFQLFLLQPRSPSWTTPPTILNLLPISLFKVTLAIAPAATRAAVSLADCLPPPR